MLRQSRRDYHELGQYNGGWLKDGVNLSLDAPRILLLQDMVR